MHQLLMSQTDDIWQPSCNLMTCKSIVAALSVVMTLAADLRKPASAYRSMVCAVLCDPYTCRKENIWTESSEISC